MMGSAPSQHHFGTSNNAGSYPSQQQQYNRNNNEQAQDMDISTLFLRLQENQTKLKSLDKEQEDMIKKLDSVATEKSRLFKEQDDLMEKLAKKGATLVSENFNDAVVSYNPTANDLVEKKKVGESKDSNMVEEEPSETPISTFGSCGAFFIHVSGVVPEQVKEAASNEVSKRFDLKRSVSVDDVRLHLLLYHDNAIRFQTGKCKIAVQDLVKTVSTPCVVLVVILESTLDLGSLNISVPERVELVVTKWSNGIMLSSQQYEKIKHSVR